MTTSKKIAEIFNGPSKWDLSVALFDRKAINCRKVIFSTKVQIAETQTQKCSVIVKFKVVIRSVYAEDNSGESWSIEGSATKVEIGHDAGNQPIPTPPVRVFIHFRTDKGVGYMHFLD